MLPSEPDEVDELIERRASADPLRVLQARVAAMEQEQRRLALSAVAAAHRARRMLWGSLAGLWTLAASLPWIHEESTHLNRSLLTSFMNKEALVAVVLGVLLPAAFIAVVAWRLPRWGGVLMLVLAAYLVGFGFRDETQTLLMGPVLAAACLVVAGVSRLLDHE